MMRIDIYTAGGTVVQGTDSTDTTITQDTTHYIGSTYIIDQAIDHSITTYINIVAGMCTIPRGARTYILSPNTPTSQEYIATAPDSTQHMIGTHTETQPLATGATERLTLIEDQESIVYKNVRAVRCIDTAPNNLITIYVCGKDIQ